MPVRAGSRAVPVPRDHRRWPSRRDSVPSAGRVGGLRMTTSLQDSRELELNAALQDGLWPELRSVTCDVSEQHIVLTGRVPSFFLKQVAQSLILERVRHPMKLENRLEVFRPTEVVSQRS